MDGNVELDFEQVLVDVFLLLAVSFWLLASSSQLMRLSLKLLRNVAGEE